MSSGPSFNMHIIREPWDEMQAEIKDPSRTEPPCTPCGPPVVPFIARSSSAAPTYIGDDPRPVPGDCSRNPSRLGARSNKAAAPSSSTISPTGSKKKGTAVHRHTSGKGLRGVPLYAPKMEERYGYMHAGLNVGLASRARGVRVRAYNKAFAKWTWSDVGRYRSSPHGLY